MKRPHFALGCILSVGLSLAYTARAATSFDEANRTYDSAETPGMSALRHSTWQLDQQFPAESAPQEAGPNVRFSIQEIQINGVSVPAAVNSAGNTFTFNYFPSNSSVSLETFVLRKKLHQYNVGQISFQGAISDIFNCKLITGESGKAERFRSLLCHVHESGKPGSLSTPEYRRYIEIPFVAY